MRPIAALLFSLYSGLTLAQSPTSAAATPAPTLVVFSDFACPYSADFFFSLQRYRETHPGKLNVLFKQSPLNIHPGAELAHRAALAAGRQGQFDAMAQLLFANQQHQDRNILLADARQLHLDMKRFSRDLDSPAVQAELENDMNEASALGVDSTPTYYLRGKTLSGTLDDARLSALVAGNPSASITPVLTSAVPDTPPLDSAVALALERDSSAEFGPANAPLTIVEFTDFQCPYCRAAAQPLEQFAAAHPNDVRIVLHSFPLDFHPDSELANEAALAAGEQGQFWAMHDLLFAHQDALKLASLRDYARQLHLDMNAFDEAVETHRLAGKISADRALGTRAGVDGTPTFFVNGQLIVGGRSTTEWEQLLALNRLPASQRPAVQLAHHDTSAAHVISGPPTAPITLTWYTDVRSSLAPAQAALLRSLIARYGDKLRILFKADPLAMHMDATLAGAALMSASAQDHFWPMYDSLAAHKAPLDRLTVLTMAANLRLDTTAFATALDAAQSSVQADLAEAQRRGILGAPVIFLNDDRVDGLQRESFYTAIADRQLKQTGPAEAATAIAPSAH